MENKLKEVVYTAIGKASMCWLPNTGSLEFDGTEAIKIGDKLIKDIEDFYGSNYKDWDDLFGILSWKFKPAKNGDMFLDSKEVYEELKDKFTLIRKNGSKKD